MNSIVKQFLCFLFCIGISYSVHAQSIADTIEIRKNNGNIRYYYHGLKISEAQLEQIIITNDSAFRIHHRAKIEQGVSLALGISGGFMLGWGISSSFFANELMPMRMVSGIALILISVPFTISYEKGLLRATRVYNEGIRRRYPTPAN